MRVLGPRLEIIKYGCFEGAIGSREWELSAAWDLCSNLQVLSVTALKLEEARAIMHTPKHRLKEIRIYFTDTSADKGEEEDVAKKILNIFAAGTRNVEIFQFHDYFRSMDVFEKFVGHNKCTLRSVTTINISIVRISQSHADKLKGKFLECPLLQDISRNPIPAESVLSPFKRGIHFRRPMSRNGLDIEQSDGE